MVRMIGLLDFCYFGYVDGAEETLEDRRQTGKLEVQRSGMFGCGEKICGLMLCSLGLNQMRSREQAARGVQNVPRRWRDNV